MQDIAHTTSDGNSPFDQIKQCRADGSEFWSARDLMEVAAYGTWERFQNPLERAMRSAEVQGIDVENQFRRSAKSPEGGGRERVDFHLSRFAAYLVAMNGDPNKPEVAAAQSYFAIRTREAETQPAFEIPSTMAGALRLAADEYDRAESERAARVEAETRSKSLEAPASAWSHMAESTGDYGVADAAKVLSRDPNISIGRTRLFMYMAVEGWIYRDRSLDNAWKAYQTQVDCKRLVEKLGRPYLHEPTGMMRSPSPTIRVTPKGLAELHKRLGGGGQLALMGVE